MKIVYSPRFLEHVVPPGFPESPDRVTRILDALPGARIIEPKPIQGEELLCVHSRELVGEVRRLSATGTVLGDNPFSSGTFDAALASASAALTAATHKQCFAVNRPPGHHASRNSFAGFCFFNNVAFAVQRLLDEELAEKVLIVDFDAHHGNGTQAIFTGRDNVFYVSTHQSPFYPGTGLNDGANYLNAPLPAGTTGKQLLDALKDSIERALKRFPADYLAVSAGFDCSENDPLASLKVTREDFREIGAFLHSLQLPSFAVLEGGYGRALGGDVRAFLEGFY